MRVILNSTYTGEQEVFEGDPSSIYSQIVTAYPFLETHDEEHQGDLDSLLEDMNSMQIFDAYIEGSEDLNSEDDEEDAPKIELDGNQLDKSDLYVEYQSLEKGEKMPHYLKFMGDHPKAQETAHWADSNLNHRNLAEFAMRHAKTKPEGLSEEEKAQVKHFGDSLHMPEVQKAAGQLNKKHSFESGIKMLQDAHAQYAQRHAASAPKLIPEEGQKLLDLGDGVAAYNLGKEKNQNEATAMGHCATPHSGGELWSIRRNHGNGMVEPLVTLSHEDGYIGEVKGKYNWKPSEKHHPYIAKLMASDLVKGFVGGGYAPESNFEFSDMKEGLRKKLFEHKPALTAKVYKEFLPQGFQGDYNHSPEIKSVFNSTDANAQIEHLKSLPTDSTVHEDAAENPHTSHEALRYLVDAHKNSTPSIKATVYSAIASNPNIPPELLHHLATTDTGEEVLNNFGVNLNKVSRNAASNKQASPETHRFLINKAKEKYEKSDEKKDFWQLFKLKEDISRNPNSHPKILEDLANEHLGTYSVSNSSNNVIENLVANASLPQNVLKRIVQSDHPNPYIHASAAFNRKSPPELLQYLADTTPYTHSRIAYNPGAPKDLLVRLGNINEPGSEVHHSLSRNPEAPSDLLEDLYAKNKSNDRITSNIAKNPKASPKLLSQLIDSSFPGSELYSQISEHPQFSKLPLEYQKKVRPLADESIQKIISLMNDENDSEQAEAAKTELVARRKAKYDKILSPEGNLEELQHLAESHDEDISKRARAELKRRGLFKMEGSSSKIEGSSSKIEGSSSQIDSSLPSLENFRQNWHLQVSDWQENPIFNEESHLEKSDWGTPLFQTHDWKYLGSGHQGHVYQASPEAVVKVSKTTPFNKMNPLKTPLQARNDVMDEHDSISGMQGHPLAPKHYGTWRKGSKVYLAREALTPIKDNELNESDLDYVREQMYDAFKSGYMPIDRIQLGRNSQGQIKIMDMGGMKKRTSKSPTVTNWDKQDLTGHLKYLFSKHGEDLKSHKHIPTEILQEEVGRFSKLSDFLASKQEFVDWKNSRTNELTRRAQATESHVTKSESANSDSTFNAYADLIKGFKSQWGGTLPDKDNSHVLRNEWWHGSPSGKFPLKNIHLGSKQAAHEALTARIGHPVEGEWDGTREYGKTLLAGQKTLRARGIHVSGYSASAPLEDHYPTGQAIYSDGSQVSLLEKPAMLKFKIKGPMTSSPHSPRTDMRANQASQRATFKRGVYYVNEGEDVGSISAVVPSAEHLEISHDPQHPVAKSTTEKQNPPKAGGLTVWRLQNLRGEGPYESGAMAELYGKFPNEELKDARLPATQDDFHPSVYAEHKEGKVRSGFTDPTHAEKWFGPNRLKALLQMGFNLHQVPATKVWQGKSGKQVLFAEPKSEIFTSSDGSKSPVAKSESLNLNLVNSDKHSALKVARYMLGFTPQSNIVFDSAKFLVAGKPLSLDVIRRAIYEKDGNLEEAALQAYGLEINESNLKALRAVVRTKQAEADTSAEFSLQKKEDSNSVQIKQIAPALPEGFEAAEFVHRASDSDNISHIKLHGKHSTGSLLAIDPQSNHMMLLKPNFGGPGPASGAQEELASPAKREVAFSHVARHWGLSKWVPQADLLNLDGKEFAAIRVLPWSWQGLEKLRETDPSRLLRMLNKYLAVGTLHKWAVLDYVLGNTDRHGQNMMGDFETEELALIDHGSTMAGPSFNPSADKNSFVPFYLRALTSGKFNFLSPQEKLKNMPTLSTAVDKEVSDWILSLNSESLESMLRKYGINPAPALNRLKILRQKIAHHNRADQSINSLWVTT